MRLAIALSLLVSVFSAGTASARPTDTTGSDLVRYSADETIEHVDTDHFRVFFTRAGKDAVLAGDVNSDGTPDFVTQVAALYEEVLAFYTGRGYLAPPSDQGQANNGGDGRFDVYLVDFGGAADGRFQSEVCTNMRCTGYMSQENDFTGYAYPSPTVGSRVVSSHEFFHAVQAGYNATQSSIVAEGTAVWSTEQFDASLTDLEGFVGGYLSHPDHSLDRASSTPVDPFTYGSAIFFQFLGEKLGHDVVLEIWQDCVPGAQGVADPDWFSALAALLTRKYATDFADAFTTFATWNLFTNGRADPSRGYAGGAGYPSILATPVTLPYTDTSLRVFYASSQVLSIDPGDRTQLVVQIVPTAGASLDSLRIVTAPVVGNTVGTVTTTEAAATAQAIDVTTATKILVELVQTAQSGDSARGTVCAGSPDEVATCVAATSPNDMGTITTPMKQSGGCDLGAHGSPASPLALLLVVALFYRRRPAVDGA
ncbi:MAG: MXAN_6640 family putative metalloprotease [Polyangia bacterium]